MSGATTASEWRTRNWDELKAETQARADRGAYPVFDISSDDAREALAAITSLDPDEWGAAWMALGDRYAARNEHLKAWRLYTLGRWPVASSPKKRECQLRAQQAFERYGESLDPKIERVVVPLEGKSIVALLQKPNDIARPPVVISIGGSDLWKDNVASQSRAFLQHGIAVLAVDMPGAGEAPLPARAGAERIYSALIDHVATRDDLDGSRIVVRGQSWGSYWSLRTGYAEPKRLAGVVFQSGPVDRYFSREWQQEAFKTREFLFDYVPSRLHMLGARDVEEAYALMASLSLREKVSQPTPPMLVMAGAKDTQIPFEDFVMLLKNGSPKHAWVNPEGVTMGRSLTLKDDEIIATVVIPWVRQRFGL